MTGSKGLSPMGQPSSNTRVRSVLKVSYQSARARATIRTVALLAQVEESRQPGGAPGDRGGMGPATIMKKKIGAARDQIQATTTLRLHYPTSPNITQLDDFGTR